MLLIWWFWSLLAVCASDTFRDRAEAIMRTTPVIDGHNDLPWQLLTLFNNQLLDSKANLTTLEKTHTNIPKLKTGYVGGQVHPLVSRLLCTGISPVFPVGTG